MLLYNSTVFVLGLVFCYLMVRLKSERYNWQVDVSCSTIVVPVLLWYGALTFKVCHFLCYNIYTIILSLDEQYTTGVTASHNFNTRAVTVA